MEELPLLHQKLWERVIRVSPLLKGLDRFERQVSPLGRLLLNSLELREL